MADIRPFKAVRPVKAKAAEVAALPYDVYSREEAAEAVNGKPLSFLNIDRPETMFEPDHDMYADDVYMAAKARYEEQKAEGIYVMDGSECYYIYEQTMNGRSQTGIAALSSVDDYLNDICKKHEKTVEKKEEDRARHVDTLSAQTGPIFLSYHARADIDEIVREWKNNHEPENDFVSEDGIGHRVWVIDDAGTIARISSAFSKLPCTYIADGHHRCASAVRAALKRRKAAGEKYDRNAEYNYFLSVLFPDSELAIMDYNRVVKDLNGFDCGEFLEALEETFEVELTSLTCEAEKKELVNSSGTMLGGLRAYADDVLRPSSKYEVGMYLNGRSYRLKVRPEVIEKYAGDPVKSLDVSILQDEVLSKLLSIQDPRTDSRIEFVGGIRGLGALVKKADAYTAEGVKTGRHRLGPSAAFAMYPTSIAELFAVADEGLLMPPKSTWFEPKLRSGLFIHEFES
ncbi:MAG: DUF1015 family protein [Eubacteriales bacterium]|nr:DUF1015 family protein [Eubacteriales bacterium]